MRMGELIFLTITLDVDGMSIVASNADAEDHFVAAKDSHVFYEAKFLSYVNLNQHKVGIVADKLF